MRFVKKLFQIFFVWNVPAASEEELLQADAIVTQAFSRTKDNRPGPGNGMMASLMRQLHLWYGLPILAQEEVAWAAPKLSYACVSEDPNRSGNSTASWNTWEVAKVQAEYCTKRGWKKVIVVAVPDHMLRSLEVYRKLGLEPLAAPMHRRNYCSPSLTAWTCWHPWLFRLSEIGRRLLFWRWGYM